MIKNQAATEADSIDYLDYVDSFTEPAEFDFLTAAQKKSLEQETAKLNKSIQHYKAVFGNSNWSEQVDKDILQGDIYSIQQALAISDKIKARNWYGARVAIDQSLVSPTGQRIIMSENCSEDLELNMDGYITKDSLDELVDILSAEGIDSESIQKVKMAADKFGGIVMQNGIFVALKPLMQDFLTSRDNIRKFEPSVPVPSPKPVPLSTPAVQAPEMTAFEKRLAQVSAPMGQHGVDLEVLKHRLEAPMAPKPNINNPVNAEIKREVKTAEIVAPKPSLNNPVNAEIKREVATNELPAHLEPKPIPMPAPYIPRPAPAPIQRPVVPSAPRPVIQTPRVAAMSLASLDKINSIDDLKKIEPGHLRQGSIVTQSALIKSKVMNVAISARMMPYYAVLAFEQSPLFKIYLQIGALMMNDVGVDRTTAFKDASKKLGNNLTLDEFEAVADLRKSLEQL